MKLEDLYRELSPLDVGYLPQVKTVENAVAFILDTSTEVLVAINRQVTHRDEVSIYLENDQIKVVANSIYLDFETPTNNSHLELLIEGNLDSAQIHAEIEAYKQRALRKFWPSALLAKICGKSPKPLCWQIEFATCHIANHGLIGPSGLIRADGFITDLMGGISGEIDPKVLKRRILESLY